MGRYQIPAHAAGIEEAPFWGRSLWCPAGGILLRYPKSPRWHQAGKVAVKELPGAFRDELEMPLSPVITPLSPVITGLGEVAARWGPCRGWPWAETRQGWGCEHLAGAPAFIWGQSTLLGTGYRGDRGKKPGTSLSVAPYPCPATPKQTHRSLYIFFPFNALLLPPFHMPPRPQLVAEQQGSLMGSGF